MINIKPISKFSILDISHNRIKKNKVVRLSTVFWNFIFSKEYLEKIFEDNNSISNQEKKFILEKIDIVKYRIDFVNNSIVPNADDIFISYRIFDTILYCLNDFFKKSKIKITLRSGIIFKRESKNINDLLFNINYYKKTVFFNEFIKNILYKNLDINKLNKKSEIFKFEVFWPDEFIFVGILSSYLKKINKDNKIILDLSLGNEQFDFTQWVDLIKKGGKDFFDIYDFVIVDRDFGNGVNSINKYINGVIYYEEIKNVIFYKNNIIYKSIDNGFLDKNNFIHFIQYTFNKNNISKLLGNNSLYARFLPYKCYWSKCNFCAINSNNKFSYDNKFSHDFFINKWINFIKENDIKSINFKDEAIPPVVIINFSKKIIENKLNVNFQFRTRFEKLYTYENCKILKKAGCGYCGIGLESAVDRVNEEIGNKGNIGITIKDKIRIIHNFDKAGISFHNYSIMGFPGETEKEAGVTYKFLRDNIINSNYYTCTPNIFGLMKGPKIFQEKEKFGIEIEENDEKNDFKLIYDFKYKGKERNLRLLKKFEEDLHKTQFLPWLDKKVNISGRGFWDYIDRGYIFYLMKRYHGESPYYKYMNINKNILNKGNEIILNSFFEISDYIQLFIENDKLIISDRIGCDFLYIDKKYYKFLKNYDNNMSLLDNLNKFDLKISKDIIFLLERRILMFLN